jgi:predicted RNA binding protein YcfA (HicA-like mRNA interferase family)
VLSSKEVIKALKKAGFNIHHQKGSHISLRRKSPPPNRIVVPAHKELKAGMLRAIIRQAGLSVEDFLELLGKK